MTSRSNGIAVARGRRFRSAITEQLVYICLALREQLILKRVVLPENLNQRFTCACKFFMDLCKKTSARIYDGGVKALFEKIFVFKNKKEALKCNSRRKEGRR